MRLKSQLGYPTIASTSRASNVVTMVIDDYSSIGAPLTHGGDLSAARRMFPDAPEPFIDLSTGINPFSYPLPAVATNDFIRLPDRTRIRNLAAIAARWYGASSAEGVVLAPGTQILLPIVAALIPPGGAAILGPTYSEHLRAATLAGHRADQVAAVASLSSADLAVVVNPNNPDGRIVPRTDLRLLARDLRIHGGLLVLDEAFADVAPPEASFAAEVDNFDNVVVLRSFGKFFGLAGLRLGFALTSKALASRIDALLGPWAVGGPTIAVAEQAMTDAAWASRTIVKLNEGSRALDKVLSGIGLAVVGGTALFRLTESRDAQELFMRLGAAGILVRRYEDAQSRLRWGIPGSDMAWRRLRSALGSMG